MKCVSLIAIAAFAALSSVALAADLDGTDPTLEYALVATASNMFNWSEFDGTKPEKTRTIIKKAALADASENTTKADSLVRPISASTIHASSKNIETKPIHLTDPGDVECNASYACAVPTSIVATLQVRSGFSKTNYLSN